MRSKLIGLLRTINAFRRPSKSDKIEPRRDPATLAVAHDEAGEAGGDCDGVDVVGHRNDDGAIDVILKKKKSSKQTHLQSRWQ